MRFYCTIFLRITVRWLNNAKPTSYDRAYDKTRIKLLWWKKETKNRAQYSNFCDPSSKWYRFHMLLLVHLNVFCISQPQKWVGKHLPLQVIAPQSIYHTNAVFYFYRRNHHKCEHSSVELPLHQMKSDATKIRYVSWKNVRHASEIPGTSGVCFSEIVEKQSCSQKCQSTI